MNRLLCIALAALCGTSLAATVSAQGMLIPRDEGLAPLSLASHEVDVDIRDHAAVTHVTQEFENHTGQMLEATYYFAMPPGAVTTDFALWMNGERIAGEVLPRDQARATYEGIVARMRDPGLLEYIDGELFQARIFPIPANGTQRVEIEFASTLPQSGDTLHYRYPLHESAGPIGSLVVDATIQSRNQIASVYAPYHRIEDLEQEDGSRRVTFEQRGATADEDFELFIGLTGDDLGFSMITWDDGTRDDDYFMLSIAPSPELEDLEVMPKQVTFVVDTSGSMSGDKIEQAREMLRYCVRNLDEQDTFQLIGFSGGVRAAFDEPMRATRGNVADAMAFIDALQARGNTNISEALARALEDPASPDRPHAILFVTDGLPTAGDTSVESILASTRTGISDGDRRVFAFGVGYDVNTRLLDGMARRGRGESGYVRPNEDMSDVIGEFYDGIGSPLLTQLELDFGRIDVRDVYPNPLPDLYRGRAVTVFGRFDADHSSSVVVRGRAANREYVMEHGADFVAPEGVDTSFVGSLWANRRVHHLLDQIDEQGEERELVDEVTALATRWGIVTPYTSYLAVEPGQQLAPREPMLGRTTVTGAFDDLDEVAEAEATTGGRRDTRIRTRGDGASSFGGAGRGSAPAAAAPAPMARRPASDSGAEAVEQAIARNEDRERMQIEEAAPTRAVAGRTFQLRAGVWVEDGLEDRVPDERIDAMSDAYFALLRDVPTLSDVLALGDRVRFRHNGRVIEIQ